MQHDDLCDQIHGEMVLERARPSRLPLRRQPVTTGARWLACIAAASLALGCGSDTSDDRNRPGLTPTVDQWTVLAEPVLEIGVDDARPGHDLSSVIDVALMDDGSVVVGDGANQELRRFSAAGEFLGSSGRRGQGPGDLSYLESISVCAGGWLAALQPRRVTVFAGDGVYQRMITPPEMVPSQEAVGVDATCEQVTWLTRERMPFDQPGVVRQPWTLTRTSPKDTVEVLRFTGLERYSTELDGLPAMVATPWMPEPLWVVLDSTIVWTSGASGTLRVWRQGVGWRDVQAPVEARLVSDRDRAGYQAYRASRIALNPPEARSLFPLDELPSVPVRAPAISTLLADGDSRVWIRPYPDSSDGYRSSRAPGGADGDRWLVLNIQRGELSAVRVPPFFRLLAIAQDRIAGVREAEDGAEHVLVYRLDRH